MILVQTVAITLPLGLTEQFQCHQLVLQQRFLIAGLSSGTLAIFRRRIDSTTLQELVDSKPRMLEGHTGALSCLLIGRAEGLGSAGYLLFSASADRTVRVWDPAVRDLSKACVQTLRGHGGTVTAIAFCHNILITASTDRTIKLWKADEGRELMLYPWFAPQQTLSDLDCWVNDVAFQLGETEALYVGDERGDISAYKVERAAASRGGGGSQQVTLTRWRRQAKAHSLGIETLRLIIEEQLLITSGYDNAVRLWDAVSGAAIMQVENEVHC